MDHKRSVFVIRPRRLGALDVDVTYVDRIQRRSAADVASTFETLEGVYPPARVATIFNALSRQLGEVGNGEQ